MACANGTANAGKGDVDVETRRCRVLHRTDIWFRRMKFQPAGCNCNFDVFDDTIYLSSNVVHPLPDLPLSAAGAAFSHISFI